MKRIYKLLILTGLGIACTALFFNTFVVEGAEILTIKEDTQLKSSPGEKSKTKTLILGGTKVERTGKQQGSWLEIKYGKFEGWIHADSVLTPEPVAQPVPNETELPQESVASTEAPVQTSQSMSPEILEVLRKKDEEINRLKQALVAQEAEVKSKTDMINQLTGEINALKVETTQFDQAGEGVSESQDEARNKIATLENQVVELQKALSDKSAELEALTVQNAGLTQQLAQEKPARNWSAYLTLILLILLVVLAIYTFRYRIPWNAAQREMESSEYLGAELEKREPSLSSMSVENRAWKELTATAGITEEERISRPTKKVITEEVTPTVAERDKDVHTRRIKPEPETDLGYTKEKATLGSRLATSKLGGGEESTLLEGRFDIRLSQVGDKKDKVLQMLSKVKGLVRSPEELISSAPCIIARNVDKPNAEKFRHYMSRVGATIELVKSEDES